MNRAIQLGTWAEIPSPYATDILSKAGFDFSIIDMEHGIIDFTTAQNMVFAAHGRGKQAYIRVPAIEEPWILRSLDTGCDGVIFPQVATIADVKKIIRFSYYAPVGERGFNPYITAGGYSAVPEGFSALENSRIQIGIILEGKEGFENLDSILTFEEINLIYIGQYDLSMALGIPGDVNNPMVLELMERAVGKVRSAGKMAGCMVHSASEAKKVIAQGFDYVVYKVDSGLLFQIVSDFVEEVCK